MRPLGRRTRFGIEAEAPEEFVLPPTGRVSVVPQDYEGWLVEVLDNFGVPQASVELKGQTVALEGLQREHWRSEATNGILTFSLVGYKATVKFLAADMLHKPHDLDRLIASVEFWQSLVACGGRLRILKQDCNGDQSARHRIAKL